MTEKSYNTIADRVKNVQSRIQEAALRAQRDPAEITLVGVTKTRTAQQVRQLIQAGVTEIGENRVQEMLQKQPGLEGLDYKMHLIGHLQRNKAKYLPGNIQMLQSLDSHELLTALEKAYADADAPLDVLIEVNVGGEENKNGVEKSRLMELAHAACESPAVRLCGLMAIPPFVEGEKIRMYFQQMYNLFVDIKAQKMDNSTVRILSMGMSSDFEYAIQEGATMVRVGTDLFGPRQ